MTELPRAPYVTERVISDSDTTEALRLFEAAGIDCAKKLLLLAQACARRSTKGHGRVVIVWGNGEPVLLLEEDSTRFDSVGG